MSDAGPLPPPRGRRTWLWVTVGVLGACILLFCGFSVWANTAGEGFLNDLQTEMAEELTASPVP